METMVSLLHLASHHSISSPLNPSSLHPSGKDDMLARAMRTKDMMERLGPPVVDQDGYFIHATDVELPEMDTTFHSSQPHAEADHVRMPNVIVAHTRNGVEVVHLHTGNTITQVHRIASYRIHPSIRSSIHH